MARKDRYGRSWGFPKNELCPVCGQPDSSGSCNHKKLSETDVRVILVDYLGTHMSKSHRKKRKPYYAVSLNCEVPVNFEVIVRAASAEEAVAGAHRLLEDAGNKKNRELQAKTRFSDPLWADLKLNVNQDQEEVSPFSPGVRVKKIK